MSTTSNDTNAEYSMDDPTRHAVPSDPFVAYRIYPDPTRLFSRGPRPITEVQGDYHVVFDTNALLIPYTTRGTSLKSICEKLELFIHAGRLTIPGHVAREFVTQRSQNLSDLFNALRQRQTQIETIKVFKENTLRYSLLESLPEYDALVKVEKGLNTRFMEMNQEIGDMTKRYKEAIESLLDVVQSWYWDDPVTNEYSRLFVGPVVRDVEMSHEDLYKDYQWRRDFRIPPGFRDSWKEGRQPKPGGAFITNEVGDLIIWHTILEIGREKKKPLVFVCGDHKNDWWVRSDGKPLYPRYELIEEYSRASEGCGFYMATLSEFLKMAGAPDDVVQEVKAEESKPAFFTSVEDYETYQDAVTAISTFFRRFPEVSKVEINQWDSPRIMVVFNGGERVGVDVVTHRPQENVLSRIQHFESAAELLLRTHQLSEYFIIHVANSYQEGGEVGDKVTEGQLLKNSGLFCINLHPDGQVFPTTLRGLRDGICGQLLNRLFD